MLTTIEFGQITFEDDFVKLLDSNGLNITYMERLKNKGNIFHSTFRMFVVETELKKQK
jgi:hypothetical protein